MRAHCLRDLSPRTKATAHGDIGAIAKLIDQLKSGMRAPVNTLCANWAYMTMAALDWSLRA